jgi:hypothetical protein
MSVCTGEGAEDEMFCQMAMFAVFVRVLLYGLICFGSSNSRFSSAQGCVLIVILVQILIILL